MIIEDMPKIECPFVRELSMGDYLVTPKIMEGYDWVFSDPQVEAIEKLHGTNVSVVIQDGNITAIFNRTERIPFFNKSKSFITEGVLESYKRGYMDDLLDGQWFGELIGEKVNGNPYNLKGHVWIPFKTFARKHLKYKSWGKYPKDFVTISEWFKELQPLYCWLIHGKENVDKDPKLNFVEGIVFTHPDGRYAKLRRDCFNWYKGPRHKEAGKNDSH